MKRQILVTGGISQGKTTLLLSLSRCKSIDADGVISIGSDREHGSGLPAGQYRLLFLKTQDTMIWASRCRTGKGFIFSPEAQAFLDKAYPDRLTTMPPQVLFLDELGTRELKKSGLHTTLKTAFLLDINTLICTVKKECLDQIKTAYQFKSPLVLDLDRIPGPSALKQIISYLGWEDALPDEKLAPKG